MASTSSRSMSAQNWCLNYVWTYNDGGWNTNKGGYAGHTSGNGYYLALMQLTTPGWTGIVSSVRFTICARKNTGNSPTLRWALATSIGNRNSYKHTSGGVGDGYQLASGTVTMSGIGGAWGYYSFTANTPTLRPNTTYYLYLWAYSSNNNVELNTAANHTFYVNYSAVTTPKLTPSSGDMGSEVVISTAAAAADTMTHKLEYRLADGDTQLIAEGVGKGETVWTVPDCAQLIPNDVTTNITVICTTYAADGSNLGSTSVTFIATVPADRVPVIEDVAVTDAQEDIAAQFGSFIQYKSRASVAVTAAGVGGSTVSEILSTLEGKSYTGDAWTAEELFSGAGTVRLSTTVTDSRGRRTTKVTDIPVLAYTPPQITAFSVYRTASALPDAPADDGGNWAAVRYAYSVPALGGGNTARMTVQAKRAMEQAYGLTLVSGTELAADTTAYPDTELTADYRWDVQITVTDFFGAVATAVVQLPTAEVILDIAANGRGLGIGKTAEMDGLDIAWPVWMRDDTLLKTFLLAAHPVGSYYWSSDPTNPADLFGGQWERVKDRFVLAAGDNGEAGAEGGEATHRHANADADRGLWACITFDGNRIKGQFVSLNEKPYGPSYYTSQKEAPLSGSCGNSWVQYREAVRVYGETAATSTMPPYITAYCWRRTA